MVKILAPSRVSQFVISAQFRPCRCRVKAAFRAHRERRLQAAARGRADSTSALIVHQANCSRVVGASGSHPRVGLLVTEETSLIEIWRPRCFGPFTSNSAG